MQYTCLSSVPSLLSVLSNKEKLHQWLSALVLAFGDCFIFYRNPSSQRRVSFYLEHQKLFLTLIRFFRHIPTLVAVAYSVVTVAPPFSSGKPIIASWRKDALLQVCQRATVAKDTRLKLWYIAKYREIYLVVIGLISIVWTCLARAWM